MRFLPLFLLLLLAAPVHAQRSDSVSLLVDSALRVMEHRALRSHQLDWNDIRATVDQKTQTARTDRDAAPALFWAFDQLGDKHGWITIADSTHYNRALQPVKRRLSAGLDSALRRGPKLYNGVVASKYAYINVHFFGGQTEEAMNRFAQKIADSLCRNIGAETKGVIVDLRLNGGGNGYPMFQGLSSIFGSDTLTEGVNGRGERTGFFRIRDGRVRLYGNHNDSMVLAPTKGCPDLSHMPVAVLIGPATGSSAEQLAIAFSSRPNTVLIGERSAGMVTANNGFDLPNSGNGIVVAEGLTRNRRGRLFDTDVQPDIEVIGSDNFVNRDLDAKIRAAVKWLKRHAGFSSRRTGKSSAAANP